MTTAMGATEVPLLESKLHVPRRRRGTVARDRLDARLDRDALPPVVLVSASAGFGKTTLLAAWIARDPRVAARTAWLSLDLRDSDPTVFWSYVIAALRKVEPGVGCGAAAILHASQASLDAVVTTLLNEIAALPDDLVLVLDDYHALESLAVDESMRFFIEHLPATMHLVVATRADPPWPLAALRVRGDLLEVRAADLRFTADEAAAYLNETMGLDLTASQVDALEARTEGWIAALQLAALSLQGRDDASDFVAGFTGDERFIVDYLVDEVLARQPDDIRSFLIDTSLLNRMNASLCEAVTGRSGAKATLEALERSNLFLVPLDDRRQWYRYHHLFGEVLRSRLLDESADRVPVLHRRASDWFEQHGDRAEAIRHALAAEDFSRAADLIEPAIPDLRQNRQDATQRAWLDALPREVFENRPVLALGLVGARMVTGDVDGVDALLDDIEGWSDPNRSRDGMVVRDQVELRRMPAQAAMYRAALALLRGDLDGTIAHGERAAALSDADDHLGIGASSALIGLAHWTRGDLERAERQYAAAIAAFERARYLADILGCSLGLADIQAARGRLRAAEQTLLAGLDLATAHAPLRGTADMHVALSELHLERNELAAAANHLRASLEVGEHLALAQHAYRWRVVDARLRAANGDHAGALDMLREAEQRYDTDYSPSVRPVAAIRARVQLLAGDVDGAKRWSAASGLAPHDEPAYLREYEQLTFARVLLRDGGAGDAVPLLQRLHASAEAGNRHGSAVEAQLLLALAYDSCGDRTQALTVLADALERSRSERFVRVALDLGAPMTALLETAARHGRTTPEVAALLAAAGPAQVVPAHQGLVDELSSRELQVLRLLRTDLSGPQIASELVVSLNTVRTHTKNIFTKLGVNSRRAAVRRADELGL